MPRGARKKAGIRDVAKAAGVSPTTVSHALSGKGRISEETRAKVVEAARKLDYVPNRYAQNLVRGEQLTVALRIAGNVEGAPVFTNWDVEYFMRLVTGALGEANKANLALTYLATADGVELSPSGREEEEEEEEEEVDGLIVVDPPPNPQLRVGGTEPIVVTTGRIPGTGDDPEPENPYWVDNDNISATRMLLDHMSEQGARSIALISPSPVASVTDDCETAYVQWMEEHGQGPRIARAEYGIGDTAGAQAAGELLSDSDPPDAILATMQGLAVGALIAANERKLEVPEQLMIASFCDGFGGIGSSSSITAVDLAPEEIGASAVRLMAELLNGNEPENPRVIVPTQVIARSSTLRKGKE